MPSALAESTYSINFEKLYEQGFRGVLFDIDNTLVGHNAPPDARSDALLARLKEMGFKCAVVSNNGYERVSSFAEPSGIFYSYKAGKPLGRGYLAAIEEMGLTADSVVSIGDQIFTDVWGANRAGIYNILVKPLGRDIGFHIYLKRLLEKPILLMIRISGLRTVNQYPLNERED